MEKSCKSLEEEIFFLVFLILYTLTYFQLVEEALSILWDIAEVCSSTETQMRQRKSVTSFNNFKKLSQQWQYF